MNRGVWGVLGLVGGLLAAGPVWGQAGKPGAGERQADRYEVGLRLKAFEQEWDRHPGEEARKRCSDPLQGVTRSFFGGRLGQVARIMDQARWALRNQEPEPAVAWAESLAVRPARRLVDVGSGPLELAIGQSYPVQAKGPDEATLVLSLVHEGDKAEGTRTLELPLREVPAKGQLPLAGMKEGDYRLRAEVRAGEKRLAAWEVGLSLVENLSDRLEKLRKAAAELPESAPRTERETVRGIVRLLEALRDGKPQENDVAAAQRLREAEEAVAAAARGQEYYTKERPGSYWLAAASGPGTTVLRLAVPEGVQDGKPRPLVIALHGAGGSENLFFEGYGAGGAVRRALERGWLVAAPRNAGFGGEGGLPDLVEELARRYPVDKSRVFLVGHSMGAMQAVMQASLKPERFAAVAALGGGGVVRPSEGLKKVPFFVGVGINDFALAGAKSLEATLRKAGVEKVVSREYLHVEHMGVVQVALPEVFPFFDEQAKQAERGPAKD